MLLGVLGLIGWYALGLVGSGFVVAEEIVNDTRFPLWNQAERAERRRDNIAFGIALALGGVLSLVLGFLLTGFGQYGWWDFNHPTKNI